MLDGSPPRPLLDRASELGLVSPGLQPGDTILSMNGRQPASFNDIRLGSAMAKADTPMEIEVDRPGVDEPCDSHSRRRRARLGLLTIGILPSFTNQVIDPGSNRVVAQIRQVLKQSGLEDVPLSRLVGIDGEPVTRPSDITHRISHAMGEPVELTFEKTTAPRPRSPSRPADPRCRFGPDRGSRAAGEQHLGLTPS